ncbi:DUF6155 family protein [Saccharicrinis sp. FJH54]|uniref:DUF6155 family protein n=1 Tax=Saccharicrinis sp. FJH54 TaxID=3344665 RepID=UPI0035D522C4
MATSNLKKFLKSLSKEELIKHIMELDKKYKPVQEYYHLYLNGDTSGTTEKYKSIIKNEFFPTRGLPKERLSVARKAISDAKKIGLPADALADLMLFYVETGASYTNEYGDIDEPFYNSMESMYLKTLKFMESEGLLEKFKLRAYEILRTTENTGWGFHDTLGDYYYTFYH